MKCVELLVEKEAKAQDREGMTALMHAAASGHSDCVALLLDKEKNIVDKDGHNARWYAVDKCCDTLAKVEPCACEDLFDAARYGCEEHYRKYIDQAGQTKACKIGDAEYENVTALMIAVYKGNAKCVKVLMEKEAKKTTANDYTALMFAAWYGKAECVRLLRDVEGGMRLSDGVTALMLAARGGHDECV